jgi:hypothetical protein
MSTIPKDLNRELNRVIAEAPTAAAALKGVYELRRSADRRVSLSWLCKRCGIPAKGNLSDVFQGRRKLKLAYRARLLGALGIAGMQATFLLKSMEHDYCRKAALKMELAEEVRLMRKAIKIDSVERAFAMAPFSFGVFCALGLFGNSASKADLLGYFGKHRGPELSQAISQLMEGGFLREERGRYHPVSDQVNFLGESSNLQQMAFLKQGFQEVLEVVDQLFDCPASFFESVIISVRREDYLKTLAEMKDALLKYQAKLETGSADLLVRMNFAIHPI